MRILLIYVLQIYHCFSSEDSQLKHVIVLFRHGDRSPIYVYPNNKNTKEMWPNGLGKLTEEGIVEQFQLGKWLRRRYSQFVEPNIKYTSIYVRSADVDRTLMSAESNLAGFYNYSKEVIKGLKWYPIPIHTTPLDSDMLLNVNQCPIVDKLKKELFNNDYYKKKLKLYQTLLELLQANTGMANLTFLEAWKVYDDLFCDKQHNMTLDNWVTENVWNQMEELNNIFWEMVNNDKIPRLSAGYFLGEIVNDFKSVISNENTLNTENKRMVFYSAHDSNIAELTALLGIYNNLQPPYCSTIMMELHYVPTRIEKWAVKIIYKNYTDSSTTTNISPVIIPGCNSSLCHWSTFLSVTKSKILSEKEFKEICYPPNRVLFIIQVIFAVLGTSFIIFIVCMFFIQLSRNKKSHNYSKIEAFQ